MKKLAFTTLGCSDWSWEKILDEAEKMGFSGIEIRGLEGKMLAEEIERFFPENKADTLASLKAHKLEFVGFGSSVQFDAAEKFDDAITEGKRAIDVCHFMGIPALRIFGNKILPQETESNMTARLAKGAQLLAEYGQDKGVLVLLETHGDYLTTELLTGVFNKVSSNNFRLLWDIGNTDCIYGDNFMDFYRPMKDLITHLHIKDYIRGTPGGAKPSKHCRIGHGQVPIKAIVKQLLSDGYSGYLTLEWEKKWVPELAEAEIAFPEFVQFINEIFG